MMLGVRAAGRVYLGMNLDTGELIAVKQLEYMESVEAVRNLVLCLFLACRYACPVVC